uniref:Chromosome 14 open reading frame 119 n=1 Tax=Oncorhynchus kisutch TaxID=8019 RepID=A0A8C7K7M5_ONCKI
MMSWFFHVNQGSNQQPPVMMPPAAGPLSSNTHYPTISSNTLDTANTAGQGWLCTQSSSSSPSLADFPSVPQGLVPPSLENLSCTSLKSAAGREPLPLSYVTLQEQRCVLSWFLSWSTAQRERFLQDLLGKAVPGKVCTLLESLNTLQVQPILLSQLFNGLSYSSLPATSNVTVHVDLICTETSPPPVPF